MAEFLQTNGVFMYHFIAFAAILFFLGVWGIAFNNNNFIVMLMSVEIMLMSVNIVFVSASIFLDDLTGIIMAMFILAIAAAEAAVGLSVILVYFRGTQTVECFKTNQLRNR